MNQKPTTFEESLKALELIVEKLNSGAIPLNESIALFEQGKQLKDHCLQLLNEAEVKIQALTESDLDKTN